MASPSTSVTQAYFGQGCKGVINLSTNDAVMHTGYYHQQVVGSPSWWVVPLLNYHWRHLK